LIIYKYLLQYKIEQKHSDKVKVDITKPKHSDKVKVDYNRTTTFWHSESRL